MDTVNSGSLMVVKGTMSCRAFVSNKATYRDATNVSTAVSVKFFVARGSNSACAKARVWKAPRPQISDIYPAT